MPSKGSDEYKSKFSTGRSEKEFDRKYEDIEPEEDVNRPIVWCKFKECIWNQPPKNGGQRTTGTLRNDQNFKPIAEREHVWSGICTRKEIGIDFQVLFGASGAKIKVPSCYVSATNKTGRMDWSKMLQSDGTPYGGSMESLTAEHDWNKHGGWYD